jgi:hypothetical protein
MQYLVLLINIRQNVMKFGMLVRHQFAVVAALLVVVWQTTTNNAPTATLQR